MIKKLDLLKEKLKVGKKRKGAMFVFLAALVILFVTTLLWIIFSQAYVPHLFPQAETHLEGHNASMETFGLIKTAWNFWPLVMIVGMVIWVIVAAQKREPDTGYY